MKQKNKKYEHDDWTRLIQIWNIFSRTLIDGMPYLARNFGQDLWMAI